MKFSIHQASDIGNRKYNQDRVAFAYSNDSLLLVLADGMGGHFHGEVAATLAVDEFISTFSRQARVEEPLLFLSETMRAAHQRIMELPQKKDHSFPGTTCIAALIQDSKLYWGHAGDSRLYLLRNGSLFVRTFDHSMVQMWLACGVIDEEEARTHPRRNQITNCLGGVDDMFQIELGNMVELQSGDVVFLCSDGLCGPFVDKDLVAAFNGMPVAVALDKLIVRALEIEFGKSDNATGLALRWGNNEPDHNASGVISHILSIP
jgi:serine/threonine protein phosphatase PrpC